MTSDYTQQSVTCNLRVAYEQFDVGFHPGVLREKKYFQLTYNFYFLLRVLEHVVNSPVFSL